MANEKDFVGAEPTTLNPAGDSTNLSPFRTGAAGNLTGERPASWITSDQSVAEEQAKFDTAKGKP